MSAAVLAPASPAAHERPSAGRWSAVVLMIILVGLGAAFFRTINASWVEEDTWYGAVYSQAAHNNLRAGLPVTAGVPATLYFGPLPVPPDAFYVHHPTLLPLMVTSSFTVFGEHEWAARLVPVLCSLASVVLLWLLVRSVAGDRAATLAAAFFAVSPMELHYGDMVDFEAVLTMWMLAAMFCARRWWLTRRVRWLVIAGACCQFALWTEWPSYFFVFTLAAVFWFTRQHRRFAAVLLALAAISAVCFLLQIRHVNPGAWSEFTGAIHSRLGNGVDTGSGSGAGGRLQFTFGEWSRAVAAALWQNFSPPLLIAAAAGGLFLLRNRRRNDALRWLSLAALPLSIPGLLYVFGLRNYSFIHDFAAFYLLGILAILAGLAVNELLRRTEAARPSWGSAATGAAFVLMGLLAVVNHRTSENMRSQFLILNGQAHEPRNLIPALGRRLAASFAPDITILANFDPYGSSLTYYAERAILNNLDTSNDWRVVIASKRPHVGGVIWSGAPDAAKILAALPAGELENINVDGIRFVLWCPSQARTAAR